MPCGKLEKREAKARDLTKFKFRFFFSLFFVIMAVQAFNNISTFFVLVP